jgi:hypothetical protein
VKRYLIEAPSEPAIAAFASSVAAFRFRPSLTLPARIPLFGFVRR